MKNKHIGIITLEWRNAETLELEATEEIQNTILTGMWYNLYLQSGTAIHASNTSSNTRTRIYISDGTNELNQLSTRSFSLGDSYSLEGEVITGEFWPKYQYDGDNSREIFTFKNRFSPPSSGTRYINTISLYARNQYSGNDYIRSLSGTRLDIPCEQSNLQILDITYKVYAYHQDDDLDNPRLNQNFLKNFSHRMRWIYSGTTYYWDDEVGNTPVPVNSAGFSLYPFYTWCDFPVNNFSTVYFNNNGINVPSTLNLSQGTRLFTHSLGLNDTIGTLYGNTAFITPIPGVNFGNSQYYQSLIYSTKIRNETDSFFQSIYLKNATSHDSNFTYLDPSTIGTSTAEPIFEDSGWTQTHIPTTLVMDITTGGSVTNARYKIRKRLSLGYTNGLATSERQENCINLMRPDLQWPFDGAKTVHLNNTSNNSLACLRRINDEEVLTVGMRGISILNVYTQQYQNFDETSVPSLNVTTIDDVAIGPNGEIWIASTTNGLKMLSSDRTTITSFTGIGSGVTDNICYTIDTKANGDLWAMFEGGLAKYSVSTHVWEVFNSSTPITFIHSEYNPTWNNVLKITCNKTDSGDQLLLSRINSTLLTWWSPQSPTPVNSTGNFNTNKLNGNYRLEYFRSMVHIPNTNKWYIWNNSRVIIVVEFGINAFTTVTAGTSNYFRPHISPVYEEGQWYTRIVVPSASSNTINYYNDSGTSVKSIPASATAWNGNYWSVIELMDDKGVALLWNLNTSWQGNAIYPLLFNVYNYYDSTGWHEYGWDDVNEVWELGNPNSKPTHTTQEDLIDGIRVRFNAANVSGDFVTGERWVGYLYDGLHKDNSTEAVFRYAHHTRDSYETDDLTASIIPASLGTTTDAYNMYTLGNVNATSFNGMVSSPYYNSEIVDNGLESELIFLDDFELTFKSNQYAGVTNVTSSTTFFGLFDMTLPKASRFSFRIRSDGWCVTENDTAMTSVVAMGADTTFMIKRVGSTITYHVDGALVYTSLLSAPNPLRGIVRVNQSETTRWYYDCSATYVEPRPAVKFGDLVNQTGVFDSRYAMMEALLTSPPSTTVLIDGVPALVHTDPTIEPQPGEVLLLQHSGILIFHEDDVGKPVEATGLVLMKF